MCDAKGNQIKSCEEIESAQKHELSENRLHEKNRNFFLKKEENCFLQSEKNCFSTELFILSLLSLEIFIFTLFKHSHLGCTFG
jgi:hypothetical protein